MVRFTFEDQDFCVVDPVAYRDALGEKSLTVYRGEVAKRSVPLEVTVPGGDLWGGFRSFAARYAAERLAVIDRDADRLVELVGGDLTGPHQFTRVVEPMIELGRDDDALAWARRGIAETNGWQIAKLYDLGADLLVARREIDAVLTLRREQHHRTPSSSTYALLEAAARALGAWDFERAEARNVLAGRDPGGLVDALLAEGDAEQAWQAGTLGDWSPDSRLWKRLAEAREPTDPSDAMAVYLRLAEGVLVEANKAAYRDAVRHLNAARRAATAAGLLAEFETKLTALRQQHHRRPTLITMLDKARLR